LLLEKILRRSVVRVAHECGRVIASGRVVSRAVSFVTLRGAATTARGPLSREHRTNGPLELVLS
jgi:hypothetical protein